MRMLLKISIPTEAGNAAIKDGRIEKSMQGFQERWNPEAMYFTALGGHRTAIAVVDLASVSDIPSMCEPLFQELEADVEIGPAMSPEDLGRGLAALGG